MPRMVSLILLIAIILLIGGLFFKVMAQFLVPMFLAVVLVVMFAPLHKWLLKKCGGRGRVAAGLTTLTILLAVLIPVSGILFQAASEGVRLSRRVDEQTFRQAVDRATIRIQAWANKYGFDVTWEPEDPKHPAAADGAKRTLLIPRDQLVHESIAVVRRFLPSAALGGVQFVVRLLIGLAIMIISLYYFLLDGPGMTSTIMRLSPLEDRYEEELLGEFVTVSRAVVIATLLSAFVQGLLAGGAFWVAGFESVFLLTALTMLLAMVPFVGATAVWLPCSLWLYFGDGRLGAAIALALFGLLVISMADNLIKPLVLHGQSNLHPLLALLSVLGGVTVLGPIGILVGPMLASFLQALLKMLQTELSNFEKQPAPE